MQMKISLNKIILTGFDLSLLLYLIAYIVFNASSDFNDKIRSLSTFLLFGFGFLLCIIRKNKARVLKGYTVWYFIFSLFGLISAIWAVDSGHVVSLFSAFMRLVIISHFLRVRVDKPEDVNRLFTIYILMTVFFGTFALRKSIEHFGIGSFYLERLGLYDGINPNTIAISLIFSIVLLIYFYNTVRIPRERMAIILVIVYLSVLLIITGSKKGILGLVFGVLLYKILSSTLKRKIKYILISLIVLIILWQCVMNIPFLYDAVGYRLESMFAVFGTGIVDGSTENRLLLIKNAIEVWSNHILFGIGLNNFSVVQTVGGSGYYAHNNYFELLADLGIIGFLIYYIYPLKLVLTETRQNKTRVCLKTIIIVILFLDMAMVSYQEIQVQFPIMLFGIVIALENNMRRENGYDNK